MKSLKILLCMLSCMNFFVFCSENPEEQPEEVKKQLNKEIRERGGVARKRGSVPAKRIATRSAQGRGGRAQGRQPSRPTPAKPSSAQRAAVKPAPVSRPVRKIIARPAVQQPVRGGVARTGRVAPGQGKKVLIRAKEMPIPAGVDAAVWAELTDKQKDEFNTVKIGFEKAVVTPSKNYPIWEKRVIDQAKKVMNVDPLLKDYCREVVIEELEDTAEERGVDATEKVNSIQEKLDQYEEQLKTEALQKEQTAQEIAREKVLGQGSIKDQFTNLMKQENVWLDAETGKLSVQWFSAVCDRAQYLVDQNQLTMEEVKGALVAALRSVGQNNDAIKRLVTAMTDKIDTYLAKKRLERSPEYINNRYQTLLLTIENNENWDRYRNCPTNYWIDNIIAASRNMQAVFKMSIDDLEKQIGAQIFFVAVQHVGGRFLTAQEDADLMVIVNRIKAGIQKA